MMRLKGKVALITGVAGSRGIGYASAKRLGEEGASLAIADVSDEVYDRAKELESLGYKVVPLKLDLRKLKDAAEMVDNVLEKYGGLTYWQILRV